MLLLDGKKLPEELLSDELRRFITLNTYLSTKDTWFWEKLRWAVNNKFKTVNII